MKRFYLPLIGLLILGSFASCNQETSKDLSGIPSSKPSDLLFMQRAYPSGEIDTRAYSQAIAWKQSQELTTRSAASIWEFSGPLNTGGRISDIAVHPAQADTYFVGAASGGIFKTTNGGASWTSVFDDQQMLAIGDIEISNQNPDIIYVGTGEPNAGGGSLAYDGNGIYKSTDGGLTWESKGLPDIGSVGKIVIDPTDDQTVYVGAMGPLFRNDTNRGVYKTTNGGDTWTKVLFVSDITGIIDMAIHPTNPNIVYAASWERIRRPEFRIYGGETSRIYRSTDAGTTWTELTSGLPADPANKGRISIDISQSNPNVLYSLYADRNGSIFDVFKTSNGGNTWSSLGGGGLTNVGFHWWFGGIFVDPTNENTIYNVGFIVEKSTDGGATWGDAFAGVHVDQHALAFNPNVPGEVILGNDGGFYISSDDGASQVKLENLPITQIYRMHVDAQNVAKIYVGSQDNSTVRTTTGGLTDFNQITGGDGFQPIVDPTNSSIIYTLAQRGFLQKSTDNAASFNVVLSGIDPGELKNWDTPIILDPANSNIMYYGAERVYRSTDGAANWTAISPIMHSGPYTGNNGFGTITSIDVSTLNSNIIMVGTDDGNLWVTSNAGATWTNISLAMPDRWVTKVLTSKDDPNTIYATFSGYRLGQDNGHVYKSTNLGVTWSEIGTSLPDIPVNDIVQDDFGNLFLGTDIGVLGSKDEGISWQAVGSNMPAVVVTDLHIQEDENLLFAATYGRSSYKLDISTNVLGVTDSQTNLELIISPNPATNFIGITSPTGLLVDRVVIYNSLGQQVMQELVTAATGVINLDVSALGQGIYFAQVHAQGQQITKRFIKK